MQQVTNWDSFLRILDHPNFVPFAGMLLGAIAILAVATVTIVGMHVWSSHRQRMAMIQQGLHPDAAIGELGDEPPSPSARRDEPLPSAS